MSNLSFKDGLDKIMRTVWTGQLDDWTSSQGLVYINTPTHIRTHRDTYQNTMIPILQICALRPPCSIKSEQMIELSWCRSGFGCPRLLPLKCMCTEITRNLGMQTCTYIRTPRHIHIHMYTQLQKYSHIAPWMSNLSFKDGLDKIRCIVWTCQLGVCSYLLALICTSDFI
jgi:hypothetical protein